MGIAAIAVATSIFIAPAPIGSYVAPGGELVYGHETTMILRWLAASLICAVGAILVIWGFDLARRPIVKLVAEP